MQNRPQQQNLGEDLPPAKGRRSFESARRKPARPFSLDFRESFLKSQEQIRQKNHERPRRHRISLLRNLPKNTTQGLSYRAKGLAYTASRYTRGRVSKTKFQSKPLLNHSRLANPETIDFDLQISAWRDIGVNHGRVDKVGIEPWDKGPDLE